MEHWRLSHFISGCGSHVSKASLENRKAYRAAQRRSCDQYFYLETSAAFLLNANCKSDQTWPRRIERGVKKMDRWDP